MIQTSKGFFLFTFIVAISSTVAFFSSYNNDDLNKDFSSELKRVQDTVPKKKNALTDVNRDASVVQQVNVPRLPKNITFAGKVVDLSNRDVYERIERELISNCFWHSSTILNIKLANRYFPIIEPILKKNGIPDDIKYLAVAESNLRNVTSPANAKGIWQFIKSAAKVYKLEVNSEVDERYDIEKATEAACTYLKQAKAKFGTWPLAMASYNMGQAGLRKQMRLQKMSHYFDLNLNNETARYVPRIMAIKEVMEHPARYGFNFKDEDLYPAFPPLKKIKVTGNIANLGDFAKKHGTSYRLLKVYNPWLRDNKLTNSKRKTYYIKVPK